MLFYFIKPRRQPNSALRLVELLQVVRGAVADGSTSGGAVAGGATPGMPQRLVELLQVL